MSAVRGPCVLVVAESPSLGDVLANALERECCAVQVARSGGEALRLARARPPDLITVDLEVSTDLLAQLQHDQRLNRVPLILITTDPGVASRSLSEPIVRTFRKPFYLSEVVSAVVETLGPVARP
jgi:CheY-like chemotaxis protein